ncbi:hypothetical protein [Modestobacter sp. SSW1-42]|uniref:hypothetical protein n=1 Tax=Modestobacter sp. SSW1-42 TaxID=596372 RepID=UPI003987B54F
MLLWPAVAGLGFLLLAGLVVALGRSSTARYESERNRVQQPLPQVPEPASAVVPATVPAAAAPSAGDGAPAPAGRVPELTDPAPAGRALEAMGSVATLPQARPAGLPLGEGAAPAWWLVTEGEHRVLSGPFADRVAAEWALVCESAGAPVHALYGVRRPDGGVARRQTPEELAWLAELGDQLDRLPQEWDERMDDDDPMVTLVVEVAAALVESGLPVHDCAGDGAAGGVCLTPEPGCDGVLVSWHQHDRMSRDQVRGADAVTAVQRTMNAAVAQCLETLGFLVAPVGSAGCSLVIDARPAR